HVRALPRHQAAWAHHGHLLEPAPQAAPGIRRDLARIAGVNLPNTKRLEIGLTYIYGIGQPTAQEICTALGLSPDTKVRDLTEDEVAKLRDYIDTNHQVEGDLRRERTQAISACRRSAPTAGSATAATCRRAASARRPTRARARAR